MIEVATAITFITTVRPYVEPYVEPLLWKGVSWAMGDVEKPSDAIREVEQWKERQKKRETSVREGLGGYMYHEQQPEGSLLCGPAALNTLLQGNYFTPPDLAQIAHELDETEKKTIAASEWGNRRPNMDDTGHLSVEVLQTALKNTFDLTLVKWRSEELKAYQPVPDTQLAFVLNFEQHWFTLRRFGRLHGKGFWFNLNSFLPSPEWVGNTYLPVVLQKAEKEGKLTSTTLVYAVRPLDPNNPEHMLPETEADILAETLDDTSIEGQKPASELSTSREHSGSAAIASGSTSGTPLWVKFLEHSLVAIRDSQTGEPRT